MNIINEITDVNKQIYILGTNHLAKESALKVQQLISELQPDCVMIELDEMRAKDLMEQSKDRINKSDTSDLFPNIDEKNQENDELLNNLETPPDFLAFLHNIQQEMGKYLGLTPGMEMIQALKIVEQMQIPIYYIDQSILETFQRLQDLQEEGKKEQEQLINSAKEDPITPESLREMMIELQKPGSIEKIIKEFQEEYPHLFNILITERNIYMVNQIFTYSQKYPKHRILIIIGAGHLDDIKTRLNKILKIKM